MCAAPQVGVRSNIADMQNDPFYNFIEDTYMLHIAAMAAVLYAAGGFPFIVWGLVSGAFLDSCVGHGTAVTAVVLHEYLGADFSAIPLFPPLVSSPCSRLLVLPLRGVVARL